MVINANFCFCCSALPDAAILDRTSTAEPLSRPNLCPGRTFVPAEPLYIYIYFLKVTSDGYGERLSIIAKMVGETRIF